MRPNAGGLPALAVALNQSWADIVLVGAVTPTQVRHDVGVAAASLEEAALGALAEDPVAYWRTRSKRPWT